MERHPSAPVNEDERSWRRWRWIYFGGGSLLALVFAIAAAAKGHPWVALYATLVSVFEALMLLGALRYGGASFRNLFRVLRDFFG